MNSTEDDDGIDLGKCATIGLHASFLVIGLPINIYYLVRLLRFRNASGSLPKFGLLKLHLITADILILLLYHSTEIANTVGFQPDVEYNFICKSRIFLTAFAFYLGSNIVVIIAIERLRGVISSTSGGRNDGINTTRRLIAAGWLVSLLQASPQPLVWELWKFQGETFCHTTFRYDVALQCFNQTMRVFGYLPLNATIDMLNRDDYFSQCWEQRTPPEVIYMVCFLCMVFYIPTIVIICCNAALVGRIVRYGRDAERKLLSSRFTSLPDGDPLVASETLLPKRHWTRNARTSAIRKTTILSVAYIICWAPYNVFSFIDAVNPEWSVQHREMIAWFQVLIGLNAVLNPLIYRWSVSGQVPSYRRGSKNTAEKLRATAV